MANESKLKVAELDFDSIKNNLKAFMKSQSEFTDYNFEGSGLSILLDVLAYNTHYMGYYLNMVANEMFIDTAINRPAVVSHAKLLGYTPHSRVASKASVNVTYTEVSGGSNSALTIPRFSKFVSDSKDGTTYIFVTTEQHTVTKQNGQFTFANVEIKEGQPIGYTFTYDSQVNTKQTFVLPEQNIDISTVKVQVQRSDQNSNLQSYVLAEDATNVNSDALVYYIEENRNGKYQIYFGDNVIGKSLEDGNIVIVSYLVTSGLDANGIKVFRPVDNILPGVTPSVTLVAESSAGKMEESIESIKFTAPKSFIAQNRAVTKNDYISLINRRYPYFDAVSVWGGEENPDPVYGKVYFTVKPRGNYEVSQAEIEHLVTNVIQPSSVLTVIPEYVPPDYNYLNFVVDVVYDPRKTNKTAAGIRASVYQAISQFSQEYLNTFNNTFKISRLAREIDDADTSIENNSIQVFIEKRFRPILNVRTSYRIDFHVPLKKGTNLQRIVTQPSFEYYDQFGVQRTSYIEEVSQTFNGVDEIAITDGGSGYTDLPEVIIEGDGTGATAVPIVVNGKVAGITITNPGANYSTAVVRIVGGGGRNATGRVVLQGKKGSLRIYYFDTNNIKRVINSNVGTIYYEEGYIELMNFNPILINDAYGTLTFIASPEKNVFSTSRNAILTLDTSDPAAIDIKVSPVIS